jgi:SAM-dependent methyltransferase
MKPCPRNAELIRRLEEWYESPLGTELAAMELECLQRMLADVFGYYLIQVGIAHRFEGAIASSRIRRRIILPPQPCNDTLGLQIAARGDQLPVASDSVDAVFLPHALDFSVDARQVLREVERVLIPEGKVLILGFNALSLWGLWALMRRRQGRVPWCGTFLSPLRVGDWLSLLGFDVEMQETIMFRPPWRRALMRELSFLDSMGRRFWPILGGVYALRAVKRVSTLTPLRPSWKTRRAVLPGGAVEPTAREGSRG